MKQLPSKKYIGVALLLHCEQTCIAVGCEAVKCLLWHTKETRNKGVKLVCSTVKHLLLFTLPPHHVLL